MKKILLCPIILCLLVGCIICLGSCGDQLAKPSGFVLDYETQMLSWDRVTGAVAYSVTIGDKTKTTKLNSYSLENLEEGEYTITVVAVGDGEEIKDSAPATYSFEKKPESGLLYKLINNNTEYQLVGVGSATGDVVMESEFRGKPVTSIAPSAISNNGSITSFAISPTIKEIPKKAFYNCNAMVSVVIPDSVKVIGENAFQSCKSLKSVTIPEGVTEISESAFAYCRALESVTLGNQTVKIGAYGFSDCSALKAINLPESVRFVGDYAFSGCDSATVLTMGSSVETIGEYAFYSCNKVTEIKLSAALTTIGDSAFEYCAALKKIEIPSEVTFIGARAFTFCESLESVTIGNNVETIGEKAFLDTLYYKNYADDIVYIGNWIIACKNLEIQTNKDLTPLIKEGTVGIADGAFRKCEGFTGVSLPHIKHIGKSAFFECSNLMEVVLGPDAETIGKYAFVACEKLKTVMIKNTKIKTIGAQAFYKCKALKNVDLPESLEVIETYAFKDTGIQPSVDGVLYLGEWVVGCSSDQISHIRIQEGTTKIANYSFFKCMGIKSVSLPKTLVSIGRGAFMMCSSIEIDSFPASLKEIGDYAFYKCDSSRFGVDYKMVLPEGLERIGRSAFYQSVVCSVTIPGSCKEIGDYAFFECSLLGGISIMTNGTKIETVQHTLTLNEGIEYIGTRAFFGCINLVEVKIPDSVKEMGVRTFYGCKSLENVKIGRGVKTIPEYAFYGCAGLKTLDIARGVETIERYAFRNCENLTDVILRDGIVTIERFAFADCKNLNGIALPETLLTLEAFAFRNNIGAKSVIIPGGISELGEHAVYGNGSATIYCESASAPITWSKAWNSSFRPVIWGCEISEDHSYVISFTKNEDSIQNADATNGISAPEREGYVFKGWATTADGDAIYSASEVVNAPNGTVLYAKWEAESNIE